MGVGPARGIRDVLARPCDDRGEDRRVPHPVEAYRIPSTNDVGWDATKTCGGVKREVSGALGRRSLSIRA
jgi:hypothetical protein